MTATHNIGNLNSLLLEYQRFSGKTVDEILAHQGGQLGWDLWTELKAIAPAKGAIRAEVLARLNSGRGIKVRQSIRDATEQAMLEYWVKRLGYKKGKRKIRKDAKRLNFQNELARREIGRRESGRLFLSVSAAYPKVLPRDAKSISRFSTLLSSAQIRTSKEGGYARFSWDGRSQQGREVAEALRGPRGRAAIQRAIGAREVDIMKYVRGKQRDLMTRTVKQMVRPHVAMGRAAAMKEISRVMAGR
jgi:hypothetical protein